MTIEFIFSLALFAFIGSATPGPNNLMLLTSGTNFGFVKTIPHILGINIGFLLILIISGLGLTQIFEIVPGSFLTLKIASMLYICYLAWKIATTTSVQQDNRTSAKPFTFLQAALFQWINPKAWIFIISTIATYAGPHQSFMTIVLIASIYGLVMLPSVSIWAYLGTLLQRLLKSPKHLRIFNISAALLLIISLIPVLFMEGF